MFALMGAFLLMSAPLAMNASSQRAARKAVRAKSSKTVSKVAKPKQKKVLKETFTVNGVKFVMVQVEGGTFKMGATPDMGSNPGRDEVQVHTVTLSNFLIGQTEVTQALWQAVMGDNPSTIVQWSVFATTTVWILSKNSISLPVRNSVCPPSRNGNMHAVAV